MEHRHRDGETCGKQPGVGGRTNTINTRIGYQETMSRYSEQLSVHQMATQNTIFYYTQRRSGALGVL